VNATTTSPLVTPRELQELYERFKLLALSASAALILDVPDAGLGAKIDALLEDACAARTRAPHLLRELSVCIEAADRLRTLTSGNLSDSDVDEVRASHRRLRREMWNVIPCEYVPCCVGGGRRTSDRS
jgi:hypothetical protein